MTQGKQASDSDPGEEPVPSVLWIVSAPSGAGKTSLTQALVKRLNADGIAAAISVSYTTREPRAGESNGVHYHFVTAETFREMVAREAFLEHAEVFGRHYGTGREATQQQLDAGVQLFLDIDWQGARQVRERIGGAQSLFILPPSSRELERRLRGRGQDADEVIAARMRAARDEMTHYAEYDYLLVNDDFDQALQSMHSVVLARRLQQAAQARRHSQLIRSLLDQSP